MNSNILTLLGAATISAAGGVAAYLITEHKPTTKIERVETRDVEPCNAQPATKVVVKGDGQSKVELDCSQGW